MKTLSNFIGGEYCPPISGKYLNSFNPSTGKVHCLIPDSDSADVERAVASAHTAFAKWRKTTRKQRAEILNHVADLLEERIDEFALAESQDQGKPLSLARDIEMPRAIDNFRFFAACLLNQGAHAYEMDGEGINYTNRLPVGVTGLISPWNLPLYLMTWKIAPSLAVGNTAVCKPSELTSLTAYMLAEVLNEAGVPPGVCNIVLGTGVKAGAALTTHDKVPLISFTGGTATASSIASAAAPLFKKVGLELGGKNPNIIFADADFNKCIPMTVRSSFQNQGEICLCGSRILVEESVYDTFVERFLAAVKDFKVGDPLHEGTNMGALVSAEHLNKVRSYIQMAIDSGGKVLCGGDSPKLDGELQGGYFLNPTVVTGLNDDCRVIQEEIFGPVVTISTFKTMDEAIAKANNVRYGLSASIWTQDISKAHRTAQQLDTATVWINTWMRRDLRVPFGGMKDSGLGREGGEFSLDFYSELKNICVHF